MRIFRIAHIKDGEPTLASSILRMPPNIDEAVAAMTSSVESKRKIMLDKLSGMAAVAAGHPVTKEQTIGIIRGLCIARKNKELDRHGPEVAELHERMTRYVDSMPDGYAFQIDHQYAGGKVKVKTRIIFDSVGGLTLITSPRTATVCVGIVGGLDPSGKLDVTPLDTILRHEMIHVMDPKTFIRIATKIREFRQAHASYANDKKPIPSPYKPVKFEWTDVDVAEWAAPERKKPRADKPNPATHGNMTDEEILDHMADPVEIEANEGTCVTSVAAALASGKFDRDAVDRAIRGTDAFLLDFLSDYVIGDYKFLLSHRPEMTRRLRKRLYSAIHPDGAPAGDAEPARKATTFCLKQWLAKTAQPDAKPGAVWTSGYGSRDVKGPPRPDLRAIDPWKLNFYGALLRLKSQLDAGNPDPGLVARVRKPFAFTPGATTIGRHTIERYFQRAKLKNLSIADLEKDKGRADSFLADPNRRRSVYEEVRAILEGCAPAEYLDLHALVAKALDNMSGGHRDSAFLYVTDGRWVITVARNPDGTMRTANIAPEDFWYNDHTSSPSSDWNIVIGNPS